MGTDLSEITESEEISFQHLHNKKIGVDAFNILYQFLSIIRQRDGTPLKDSQPSEIRLLLHVLRLNRRFRRILIDARSHELNVMDEESFEEEEFIGGRFFRKLDDGRIVEVANDGSMKEDIIIDGELYSGHQMSFGKLQEKIEGVSPEEKKQGNESIEDVVQKAVDRWEKTKSKGSESKSDTGLGPSYSLDKGSKLDKGSGLGEGTENPFKGSGKKPGSFKEHQERVRKALGRDKGSHLNPNAKKKSKKKK